VAEPSGEVGRVETRESTVKRLEGGRELLESEGESEPPEGLVMIMRGGERPLAVEDSESGLPERDSIRRTTSMVGAYLEEFHLSGRARGPAF
jgi:hypothetical protein